MPTLAATAGVALLVVGVGELATFRRCDRFDVLERIAVRFSVGAALWAVVSIALYELFRFPVHAATLVVLGFPGLALAARECRSRARRPGARPVTWITVGLLAAGTFMATLAGSLLHAGFGGRDPWHHAFGAAWLMDSGQLRQPLADWPVIHYVDGYPPAFEILLAAATTLSGGPISSSLKAVAALIGAASVLAVYLLGRRVTGSVRGGVVAAVLYSVAPGALGRHVWGHSLAVVQILTGLACLVDLRRSTRMLPAAALSFAGAVLAAPSQGAKGLALAGLSVIVGWSASARWGRRAALAVAAAAVLAGVWFGPLLVRTGLDPESVFSSMDTPELRRSGERWSLTGGDATGLGGALQGAAHRAYGLDDILFFRPHVAVQPVFGPKRLSFVVAEGVGVPVLGLIALGVLVAFSRKGWRPGLPRQVLVGVWLAFAVLGAAGASTGISFYVWRFWLLVVPLASVAAASAALALSRSFSRSVVTIGVGITSVVLAMVQLALALATDTAAGVWRFWLLNPAFGVVATAAFMWSVGWLLRARRPSARIAAVLVVLHVTIACNARLRFLTVRVPPTIFRDAVEEAGYLDIPRSTPPGARVFPLSGGDRCVAVVALDRECSAWDHDWHRVFRRVHERPCSLDPAELVGSLRELGVEYLVLDPSFRGRLDTVCADPGRFRFLVLGVLAVPGTSLAMSVPPADRPSTSRVALIRISGPASAGSTMSTD